MGTTRRFTFTAHLMDPAKVLLKLQMGMSELKPVEFLMLDCIQRLMGVYVRNHLVAERGFDFDFLPWW